MQHPVDFVFVMEMIGTVAFACSGAMVAIRKNLDLLGILVLGIITAVGGGMIRDIMIGRIPPMLFRNPIYVEVSAISIVVLFCLVKFSPHARSFLHSARYETILNLSDAIGLGIFTVIGINAATYSGYDKYTFLQFFLGVITGVGGGLLRDLMAMETPSILRKHVYACASLAGAFSYVYLSGLIGPDVAMLFSVLIVVSIRVLARRYCWNLPRV